MVIKECKTFNGFLRTRKCCQTNLPSVVDGFGERRHLVVREVSEFIVAAAAAADAPVDQRVPGRFRVQITRARSLEKSKNQI